MRAFNLASAFLGAACVLSAQTPVDLNSLASAAAKFASRRVQGQQHPATLDLRLIRGDNGGNPTLLMTRASDVQRWTLFYDASYADENDQPAEASLLPRSASLKCTRGLFSDFQLSKPPIPNTKSLEDTWFATTLDGAIHMLNAYGYVRGFSQVETRHPELPEYPDETVYVFNCPWERSLVAISTSTGLLSWYQVY